MFKHFGFAATVYYGSISQYSKEQTQYSSVLVLQLASEIRGLQPLSFSALNAQPLPGFFHGLAATKACRAEIIPHNKRRDIYNLILSSIFKIDLMQNHVNI